MQDFKYLTIDDLERLVEGLKAEIKIRQRTVEDLDDILGPTMANLPESFNEKALKEAIEMLRDAEAEILERTLLQAPNDGGSSN